MQDWLNVPVREEAYCPVYYGELKVPVAAPAYYYAMKVKSDSYSYNIILSKKQDLSTYFYGEIKKTFDAYRGNTAHLICVIPSSKMNFYSPTLLKIAEMLSRETGILNENIIFRVKDMRKKMTERLTLLERGDAVKGTLALTRRLNADEKEFYC